MALVDLQFRGKFFAVTNVCASDSAHALLQRVLGECNAIAVGNEARGEEDTSPPPPVLDPATLKVVLRGRRLDFASVTPGATVGR